MLLRCGTGCRGGSEREQCHLLGSWQAFSHFHHYPQANWAILVLIPKWEGPVPSRNLWVPPTNSSVRLGVYSGTSTPTDFYHQRFWGLISPCCNPGLHGLPHSSIIPPIYLHADMGPPSLPATNLLHCSQRGCPSPPLLPVWMSVSSLTPWLLDFHVVQFSGSFHCSFVLKFVVVLLLIVQGGKVCLPRASSWPELKFIS